MRKIVKNAGEGVAVVATLWIGYNTMIFVEIAAGKHQKYIPVLHFPIKVFVLALS